MGVPHITSFCCCFGLENGSLIIGTLHMICSLVVTIVCACVAENFRGYIGTVEDAGDHLYTHWYRIACTITGISVVHALLALLLLIGICKKNTTMLRAWVIIMVVLYITAIIYIIGVTIKCGISASGSEIFIAFLEGLVFFTVLGYCILCVNSFYLLLRSSEDMEGPHPY